MSWSDTWREHQEFKPDHLSYSAINTYLTCGLRYFWRYCLKYKYPPPSAAMTLGSSIDMAANHNYKHKIETGEDAPVDELTDVFVEELKTRKDETDWSKDKPEVIESDGVKMVKAFRQNLAPVTYPLQVQQSLKIEFENRDYHFLAIPDLVKRTEPDKDNGVTIVDHKSVGRKPTVGAAAVNPQLTAYAFAYQATQGDIPLVELDYLVRPTKTLPARAITESASRFEADTKRWAVLIDRTFAAIVTDAQNGTWRRADITSFGQPNNSCSREWCGFWDICQKEYYEV